MEKSRLKTMFQESDRLIEIDQERKERTLVYLSEEIEKKPRLFLYDRKAMITNLFYYMDKTALWGCLTGSFVMLVCIFVFHYFQLENREVIAAYTVLSSVLSVLSLTGLSGMFSSNISELGESCYFHVKQMVIFQMVCSGIENGSMLLLVMVVMGCKWQIPLAQAGLYLLVPYVVTQCCCFSLFLSKAGRQSSFMLMLSGLFPCIFFSVLAGIPQVYLASAVVFWSMLFLAGIFLLGVQIKILFCEIERGEILCMN